MSTNGYSKIVHFVNEKSKQLNSFNKTSSQVQLINFRLFEDKIGKIRRMLFLSNNFSIIQFLKILNLKFNGLDLQTNIYSLISRRDEFKDSSSKLRIFLQELISKYEKFIIE